MVDVLIFYEGIQREYENDTLLRLELERRGYSVKILNTIYADYYKSFFIKSRVNVIHTIRNNRNIHFYTRSIFGKPHALVDMQYEQVFAQSVVDSGTELPIERARDTYHVCWGEESAERLRKLGIEDKYIWNIGPIQFDLLRPELRKYYKTKEELANEFRFDANKRLVLFNANFPYVTYSEETINDLIENKGLVYLTKKRQNQIDAQAELIKWIDVLLLNHSEIEFIYRPHPTEKISDGVSELDKKYSNFHVIGEYSVKQWTVVADVVNVWDSTSIMEGYYAGKQCNVCWPYPLEEDEIIYLFKGCTPISNAQDFVKANTSLNNDVTNCSLDLNMIKRLYGDIPSEPVYMRLADRVEQLLISNRKENFKVPFKFAYLKHELYFLPRTIYATLVNKYHFRLSSLFPSKRERFKKYEDKIAAYDERELKKKYYDKLSKVINKL